MVIKMKKIYLMLILLFTYCNNYKFYPRAEKVGEFEDPTSKQTIEVYLVEYANNHSVIKVAKFKNCGAGITTQYQEGKFTTETITLYEDEKVVIYKKNKNSKYK